MHIQNIHKKYGSLVAVLSLAAWKFLSLRFPHGAIY